MPFLPSRRQRAGSVCEHQTPPGADSGWRCPIAVDRRTAAAVTAALRTAGCVFAADEAELLIAAAGSTEELAALVAKRAAGLPLEHLLGWAEFAGLRIAVDPGVFVPRRRSELLVREAVALEQTPPVTVVDLCCGTGAVGAAVAAVVRPVELHAVDIDPAAVACARRNVAGDGRVYEGDLYAPLPRRLRGRVDVVVANAPYVPTGAIETMPAEARDHEPRVALDGGRDGLRVQRRVIAAAPRWLAPRGHLLVETSRSQAAHTEAAFLSHGLSARTVRCDELDATVVVGRRDRERWNDPVMRP
jgi:release factor glutamine methyltransferase